MIYCMSDIHGKYETYKKLLEKINLQKDDTLYILGDVIDRGPQSMAILLDMMARDNIIPLFGNHEYAALNLLPLLAAEITEKSLTKLAEQQGFADELLQWLENGGHTTIQDFRGLSRTQQQDVLAYLGEFSLYEEISVNEQDYVLVHAGLANFSPERNMNDYDYYELIFIRTDYSAPCFTDRMLITGHTPTRRIPQHDGSNTIFRNKHHIAIDCGAAYGGQLGAICLDTGEEFYE